jgi:N-methylhydantoinase A/oxoprolinase/acetone carboxylase beta subunit
MREPMVRDNEMTVAEMTYAYAVPQARRAGRRTQAEGTETVIRIGIDVGGTNTDAVVMDANSVVASFKAPTSADVTTGVREALAGALRQSGVAAQSVDVVALGTTHFTNAVVQRRDLAPTAAVRLGLPATQALPPMVDWPPDLRDSIGNHAYFAHGGHEFDGRPITPLDPDELRKIAKDIVKKKVRTIAISSVFSPVNTEVERQAGEIFASTVPGAHITLSSDIGRIGLLERENAAIMNACLRDLSRTVMSAFRGALEQSGVSGRFFLTQNDGTLMDADFAERFPVLTFASGPTNSMRGAAFLSGVEDAIVIDVGGTTTDVGSLHKGFPRQATTAVEIGGVRTNFRMPDVFSIGLGGGSLVVEEKPGGKVTVGPRSVGYKLITDALIFGGKTLTTSDVIVAAGLAEFGDRSKVSHLPPALIANTRARIMEMAHNAVERSRLSAEPLPVIVVGGGSVLLDSKIGELDVVKPHHFACANAVGAAIAQVSGEVDRIYMLGKSSREEALADAKQKASANAVAAGARADSVTIVDVEDVPLAYIPGNATRVRVKAVGELAL